MDAQKSTPKLEEALHDIEHPIRSPAPNRQRAHGQAMGAWGRTSLMLASRALRQPRPDLDGLINMLQDEVSSKIECWREFKMPY